MLHLSEIHGAATHLAVVAIPLYAIVLLLRRRGLAPWLAAAEPWVAGGAVAGILLAGVTGLAVRGESQTELRGSDLSVGSWHFWLGILLALLVLGVVGWRWRTTRLAPRSIPTWPLLAGAGVALVLVFAQGYLGGRMTYQQAVGIFDGGQLAQSSAGAARLRTMLVRGVPDVQAGRTAFSSEGLGCATCHGDQAQGARGPRLAGGIELDHFRHVHGHGLFPPQIVSDREVAAINAWLRTLRR